MYCPKCGAKINNGDILCENCKYPVAFMSGTPVKEEKTFNQEYVEYKPTTNIEIPPIEPTVHVKAPTVEPPKKINNKKIGYQNYGEAKQAIFSIKFLIPVIIGVIFLIFVIIGIFDIVKTKIKEKQELEQREEIKTYKLEFNNFIYEIPNEYSYQKNNTKSTLFLTKEDITITIQVMDATFSSVKSSKASIKSYFQSKGYSVSKVEESVYDNTSYLVLDAKKGTKNYVLAVTKAGDSSKCFGVSITKTDEKIDETYLENISSILKNAKYQNKQTETDMDFDFKEVIK